VKVRDGLERDDYRDPGPYRNPEGSVAYEVASDDRPLPIHRAEESVPPAGSSRINAKAVGRPRR
jgi:manganese oxidase